MATSTGSQLDYRLGWNLPFRVLSTFVIGVFVLAFLISAAAAVYRIVTGHVEAAGGPAVAAGITIAIVLLFLGLTTVARWLSRGQVALLHSWVAERLQPQS
ncbi:hypothetical protein [Dactylosporangium sp. CA-233914]|uniref:hypothetical protein n=1 Tax=Dactylosporangium sp. CA-233914 TaxID=3239934 RepID=UPI003D8A5A3A